MKPEIILHIKQKPYSITLKGNKGEWTIKENDIIKFKGLDSPVYMLQEIKARGLILIPDDTSVPMLLTWHRMLSGDSIFLDCIQKTGWIEIIK